MNGIWRVWMILWCISVGGFGLIITLGAIEATSAPTILLLEMLSGGIMVEMTPHLRFALAVMGPVTMGWALTLIGATEATRHLPKPIAAKTWLWITAGVLAWMVIDSILSVVTGFALNLIPNTLYLVAFLVPVIRSGVLKEQ
ncbi:hypothetical protein [Hasllibacter sp. MH4015]|uniref:hypothetical protein n=1 Tax=Hasllibacter sp. MH4015 TaxID=2854029 RepID=UPI001CD41FB0|nr:hypothetical protein [Hasllibacter sp. MH4015]